MQCLIGLQWLQSFLIELLTSLCFNQQFTEFHWAWCNLDRKYFLVQGGCQLACAVCGFCCVLVLGCFFKHLFLEGVQFCPHNHPFITNKLFYMLGCSSYNLLPCNARGHFKSILYKTKDFLNILSILLFNGDITSCQVYQWSNCFLKWLQALCVNWQWSFMVHSAK